MSTKLKVIGISALAIATAAFADQPADGNPVATEAQMLPESCFGGALRREISPEANVLVYDNTRANFYTNTANPRQIIDDVELVPGVTIESAFPLLINGINLGFTAQSVANVDIEVTVFDGIDITGGAGVAIQDDAGAIGTFIVQIRNLPNTGGFQTGVVDLSGLAGGGITITDGGIFVRVRFLVPGTTTISTTCTNTFATSWNVNSGWTSTKPAGRSFTGAFRDVNGDGILDATEFRNFTFPAAADQYLSLRAAMPDVCTADFNGDGIVDFFDYLDFVDAFSSSCP